MGSSGYQTPTPPTAPTATSSLQEYINLSPQLLATEKEYQPQYAQLQQQIQNQLYPQTSALQEQLAGQAQAGMTSALPDWMKQEYLNNMRAQLGENVKSTIGADVMSTGLMGLGQNWQQYYQNMALSLAGRQPLAQPQALTSGFTPQSIMGMNTSNYGTQANLYGNQLQNYWNQQNYSPPWANALGSMGGSLMGGIGGGLGTMAGMAGMGYGQKQGWWGS